MSIDMDFLFWWYTVENYSKTYGGERVIFVFLQ